MSGEQDPTPRRVLIIKPSALGDVVTAVPVLRGLRRTFPQGHIAWLVNDNCSDLIRHDPDLNEVILFDRKTLGRAWRSLGALRKLRELVRTLREKRFDWVIDLQGLLRSGLLAAASGAPVRAGFADAREGATLFYTHKVHIAAEHTVDRNRELAASLGIDAQAKDLTLEISPAGQAFAVRALVEHGLQRGRFAICVPPTRWPTKVYPAGHWAKVVADLSQHVPVVLMGGPGDRAECEGIAQAAAGDISRESKAGERKRVVNLAGQTSVAEMVGLISAGGVVICSDSAAKFIAPAVGVNVVCLLGPTRLETTGPYLGDPRVQAKSLLADVPCQGCLKRRCARMDCMASIPPAAVLAAAMDLLPK